LDPLALAHVDDGVDLAARPGGGPAPPRHRPGTAPAPGPAPPQHQVFAVGDASGPLAYPQATLPGKPKPLVLSPSIEWPPPITKVSLGHPPRR
jgi:hypothetical protein